MNVHEGLVAGRNDLARYGWKRGGGFRVGSAEPRCAGNALYGACGLDGYHAMAAVLCRVIGLPASRSPSEDLVYWNDAKGRTEEEVLAAFDEAIALTAPPPPGLELAVPSEQPVEALA